MTASLHLSKTTTTDHGENHDPEALGKLEVAGAPTENDHNASEKSSSPWEVTLEKSEDPKAVAVWYKWVTVLTVSCGAMCATCASSMVGATLHICPRSDLVSSYPQAAFAEAGTIKEFGVSHTVSILPISIYLMGLGTGPLLVGPLSEVHGALCDFHSSIEHLFFSPQVGILYTWARSPVSSSSPGW